MRSIFIAQCVPPELTPILVVVENNATREYDGLIQRLSEAAPKLWTVLYAHEPALGIPQARNACLELALTQSPDWIAFIDDDETVEDGWLSAMARAVRQIGSDVLQGPVRYVYPSNAPDWLPPKEVRNRKSGMRLPTAFTNNTLMRSFIARPDGMGLRFDESMRFTGGSDTDYFFRAADRGATIAWVDDACVREVVTSTRLTVRWQLTRALRVAANASVIHKKRRGSWRAWQRYAPKSFGRVASGAVLVPLGAMLVPLNSKSGRRLLFKGGAKVSSGVGGIFGLLNVAPQPYRRMT